MQRFDGSVQKLHDAFDLLLFGFVAHISTVHAVYASVNYRFDQ
ncbi:hypothetical protein AVU99_gp070 [Mycobacterium phage Lolly9]|uniref:Uncharacterized protein n=1 Tax=Mycobacterium phage Lolly9 TaxID=1698711 RepID=A0A0K2FMT5_9CAUD|nr:hypothetical protein AVU99_gp070 [Mycobacterium phage Lolly9]ALA48527.1 hypothetical protein LOLLY9_120 [Mycobacterium phage Lolly9]